MANTKFPITINGVKFQVNPTSLSISKPIVKGTLPTQGGYRFQIWYNAPEVLAIQGIAAGQTAFNELIFLKNNFERTKTSVPSELFYKTKIYKGFIDKINVGHSVAAHQRFPYDITFQFLHGESFNLQDLSLQPSGLLGEATDFLEENIGAPIARADAAISQTLGRFF